MVEDRLSDGKRIAQLFCSEVDGRADSGLAALDVVEADPGLEGSPDGELAYRIAREDAEFASVYVHEDRARVEFREGVEAAARAADEAGLRVRPKAVDPPRTLVFVESGAAVKPATDVVVAALQAVENGG